MGIITLDEILDLHGCKCDANKVENDLHHMQMYNTFTTTFTEIFTVPLLFLSEISFKKCYNDKPASKNVITTNVVITFF